MPFPQFLTQVPIVQGAPGVTARQAVVPSRSPFGLVIFANQTTANTALIPGGSYLNGA